MSIKGTPSKPKPKIDLATMKVVSPDHSHIATNNKSDETQEPERTVQRVRFGKKYEYKNGEKIDTKETDFGVILLSPTGRQQYTTMIKQVKGHINMYSQGIEITDAKFENGKFEIIIDLSKSLTMDEWSKLQTSFTDLQKKATEILKQKQNGD